MFVASNQRAAEETSAAMHCAAVSHETVLSPAQPRTYAARGAQAARQAEGKRGRVDGSSADGRGMEHAVGPPGQVGQGGGQGRRRHRCVAAAGLAQHRVAQRVAQLPAAEIGWGQLVGVGPGAWPQRTQQHRPVAKVVSDLLRHSTGDWLDGAGAQAAHCPCNRPTVQLSTAAQHSKRAWSTSAASWPKPDRSSTRHWKPCSESHSSAKNLRSGRGSTALAACCLH